LVAGFMPESLFNQQSESAIKSLDAANQPKSKWRRSEWGADKILLSL